MAKMKSRVNIGSGCTKDRKLNKLINITCLLARLLRCVKAHIQ